MLEQTKQEIMNEGREWLAPEIETEIKKLYEKEGSEAACFRMYCKNKGDSIEQAKLAGKPYDDVAARAEAKTKQESLYQMSLKELEEKWDARLQATAEKIMAKRQKAKGQDG